MKYFKKILLFLSLCSLFTGYSVNAASSDMTPMSQKKNFIPISQSPHMLTHSSWGVKRMGFDVFAESMIIPAKITVAVIDTGVDTDHFLLEGRLVAGYDFGENKIIPEDLIGHGTYMAGILADCTKSVKSISIMPLKVAGADGSLTSAAECRAINYAVEQGAKVISISFAANLSEDHQIDKAINQAIQKGVTVVVAAGNDKKDASLMCPSHIQNAITVGALDKTGHLAEYSNYGSVIDFVAPGSYICGADLNNETRIDSGTSAAVPHVAAAAAMLYAKYPDLTPSQVYDLLVRSCDLIGSSHYYGHGIINLANLLR